MAGSSAQNPWRRRLRRLFYFFGAAGSFYLISSYALDRMREARVRAIREKREKDLLKSHFTTLLSTISFTLYALLPTLSPHLDSAYPVESTSQAIQGLSNPGSSQISSAGPPSDAEGETTYRNTPESSGFLEPPETQALSIARSEESDRGALNESTGQSSDGEGRGRSPVRNHDHDHAVPNSGASVSESWASEFRDDSVGRSGVEGNGVSMGRVETEDGTSSVISQTISLPPTDLSSSSGSPPSDLFSSTSQLQPSPPRVSPPRSQPSLGGQVDLSNKSKKELWRDLKTQSLTRAITTSYLLPLLYILTTSQLSTIARMRYLGDVKASLPPAPLLRQAPKASPTSSTQKRKSTWSPFSSFSVEAMGLSEFASESASLIPNPISVLPTFVTSRLPTFLAPSPAANNAVQVTGDALLEPERAIQAEADQAEAERLYLTYSWWILNEGWKAVTGRVEEQVERVFGGMALKRELSAADWEGLLLGINQALESDDLGLNGTTEGLLTLVLPSDPIPETSGYCPLPLSPPSVHLSQLLNQTRSHLASPDAALLLRRGVAVMQRHLIETVRSEVYDISPIPPRITAADQLAEDRDGSDEETVVRRRLVDCLPALSRWGKGVWEGVPDAGVEGLLAVREFEGFAALIFGDWASL